MLHHSPRLEDAFLTRRDFLRRSGMGMGALAFTQLLQGVGAPSSLVAAEAINPLASKSPPFPAKAKRVVHFFLNGGMSHVDTFDPKPMLDKFANKSLPIENLRTERKTGAAFASPFKFRKHGQSGIEVSDIFPRIGECVDDLAVIRSMQAKLPNHEPSLMLMNCGDAVQSRPSVGSWVTYGLGTENQNLPGFIAMCPGGYPIKEAENWQSGFLPGVFQGTYIDTQHTKIEKLIENIRNNYTSLREQRQQLDLMQQLNADYQQRRRQDARLEARVQSFELAYRMQMDAADAFDVSAEPESIRELYGSGTHARQTLIARRLLERGVRFVQLWHGAGQPWDNHDDIQQHAKLAKEIDQPIAALIQDLKQRGMLDDTLIVFGGEFGRTPTVELNDSGKDKKGRDHNPYGFSVWLAGGGVKGGTVYGTTDEFGFKAVENVVEVHDLHATILHLLGFDHEKFTFRYAGRDFRLTDVHGRVVKEIVA
ncbi:MAG: DUF1501 domain-containing protein [Verrucomicrobia bacterium]|nr:DUF1501 domain-containing protein [Verrucomicrobiota bacterium]